MSKFPIRFSCCWFTCSPSAILLNKNCFVFFMFIFKLLLNTPLSTFIQRLPQLYSTYSKINKCHKIIKINNKQKTRWAHALAFDQLPTVLVDHHQPEAVFGCFQLLNAPAHALSPRVASSASGGVVAKRAADKQYAQQKQTFCFCSTIEKTSKQMRIKKIQ